MRGRARWLTAVAVTTLLATCGPVAGGRLAPGEGIRGGDGFLLDLNDPSFAGETLHSSAAPFEIVFEQPDRGPDVVRGTFTHLVVRESATGTLAFHYRVRQTEAAGGVIDFEDVFVRGFSGFATDVFSDQRALVVGAAERSADGDTIHFLGSEEPFSGSFVVRTDATDFDERGALATVLARAQTGDPVGGSDRVVTLGATATPVPEPAAVGVALAAGAFQMLRRRRC